MLKLYPNRFVASLAIMGMIITMSPINVFADTTTNRYAGVDRYQTASLIADEVGSLNRVAILTAGADANLVDALAAAPFASSEKAPILLTGGTKLDNFTQAELTKLAVNKVFITSGSGVITKGVTDKLTALGISYEFLGGHDRYETALNIAKKLTNPTGVIVASANDANLVDSLSASSIAAQNNMAIVLTDKDGMTASTQTYVKNLNVPTYVIGGNGIISDSVVTSLKATRVSGTDRYATNVAVLNQFKAKINFETVYVASGNDLHLVDALTGAMLAAKSNSAIILSDGATIPSATANFIKTAGIKNVVAFGGSSSVPENVRSGIISPVAPVTTPVSNGGGGGSSVVTPSALQIATNAVVKAETSKLQADVVSAQALVDALPADVSPNTSKADLEARLAVITAPVISNVSLTSNSAKGSTVATIGDTITLTFTSDELITKLSNFKINGSNPDTFTNVGNVYTATHKVDSGDTITGSPATFQINVENGVGIYSTTVEQTSNNSSVTIVDQKPVITNVKVISNNADNTKAMNGDIITLTFASDEPVTQLSNFKINGSNPNTFTNVGNNYTVTHLVDSGDTTGSAITFQINVKNTAGIYSQTIETTSNNSSVTIIPEYARISGVSISSSNTTSSAIATIGDTITLKFTTDEQVIKLSNFNINGSNPNTFVETNNSNGTYTYTVTHIVDSGDAIGFPVKFQINVENATGIYTPTIEQTTDGSSVTIN